MTEDTQAVLQRLRSDIAQLNETLRTAAALDLDIGIKVQELRVVGTRCPIITVSGTATRSRVELDERL